MDELKDAKAKAGSAVNRSPNLTGDVNTLGRPAEDTAAQTNVPKMGGLAPGAGEPNLHVAELKDAKAKAGSAMNRQPNLTGDVSELGKPAQVVILTKLTPSAALLRSMRRDSRSQSPAETAGDRSLTFRGSIVHAGG